VHCAACVSRCGRRRPKPACNSFSNEEHDAIERKRKAFVTAATDRTSHRHRHWGDGGAGDRVRVAVADQSAKGLSSVSPVRPQAPCLDPIFQGSKPFPGPFLSPYNPITAGRVRIFLSSAAHIASRRRFPSSPAPINSQKSSWAMVVRAATWIPPPRTALSFAVSPYSTVSRPPSSRKR
jgi:hypothetical protein